MTDNIHTWADGFGIWWARVPRTGNARADHNTARSAIVAELAEREGPNFDPSTVAPYVDLSAMTDKTVTYREVERGHSA